MESLDSILSSLNVPLDYNIPIINGRSSATVDYINEQFLIFSEEDAEWLRSKCRTVVEPLSADDGQTGAPFFILPEQVSVLMQYGFVSVRRLVDGDLPYDCAVFETGCDTRKDVKIDYDKAQLIAIGRKAKSLKRKREELEGANAKVLKVRKEDTRGVSVTEDDVMTVLQEFQCSSDDNQRINLALASVDPNHYVDIAYLSLPLPNTREFRIRECVFHDLWRRGFFLTTGVKFGCHYLAYEGNPGEVHAKFLIECLDADTDVSPMRMISLSRVATQVKKVVLLAFVANDNNIPHYMSLQWWKPQ